MRLAPAWLVDVVVGVAVAVFVDVGGVDVERCVYSCSWSNRNCGSPHANNATRVIMIFLCCRIVVAIAGYRLLMCSYHYCD